MEIEGLGWDSDWAPLDGEVCRVTAFMDWGFSKKVPFRASIEVESPLLSKPTPGWVFHKVDYEHLSEAFSRRESEPNSEV